MLKLMPPENNTNVSRPDVSPSDSGSKPASVARSKKPWLKVGLIALIAVIVLVAVSAVSYHVGKGHKVVVAATTTAPKTIVLPPQAIVTAQCVPGRGKQYIIPKDIPQGPIYDVENNKVIAIEYVLNFGQLLQNSDAFSTAILQLTKNYPVNHFTLVPDATSATSAASPTAVQNIHLIMFIVPQSVANGITCSGSSSSTGSSTTTGTSPTSSTTTDN